ncbi:MAG: ABC transporter ATP-binding protein [Pseudomonadota bacterium]|nr:ABC transporter ATP-binding protein [Pseudomonadota bacterium]
MTHSPLPDLAISVRGLVKTYAARGKSGPKTALQGIDLDIPRGSVFGLLGPNGAGKSTFINILAGLVKKTAGSIRVWDRDPDRDPKGVSAALGVVPQELNLDAFFTPRELLELQAGLYGVPARERQTDQLLAAVGLTDKADAYSRSLSGGMRRRLMVAKAMVHAPPILILDEPTAGVDVELRQTLWAHVRTLNRAGTTIVLTTHYLEEAEDLCDRIAIINHGRVIACEDTPALLGRLDSKTLTLTLDRDLNAVPPGLADWTTEQPSPRRLVVHYRPSRDSIGPVLAALQAAGIGVVDISVDEASLEDVFLQLTRDSHAQVA